MAPRARLELATLRLTGGKRNVSRPVPRCAGRCRSVRCRPQIMAISDLRFVSHFAGVCSQLLHQKGKKRTTSLDPSAHSSCVRSHWLRSGTLFDPGCRSAVPVRPQRETHLLDHSLARGLGGVLRGLEAVVRVEDCQSRIASCAPRSSVERALSCASTRQFRSRKNSPRSGSNKVDAGCAPGTYRLRIEPRRRLHRELLSRPCRKGVPTRTHKSSWHQGHRLILEWADSRSAEAKWTPSPIYSRTACT